MKCPLFSCAPSESRDRMAVVVSEASFHLRPPDGDSVYHE